MNTLTSVLVVWWLCFLVCVTLDVRSNITTVLADEKLPNRKSLQGQRIVGDFLWKPLMKLLLRLFRRKKPNRTTEHVILPRENYVCKTMFGNDCNNKLKTILLSDTIIFHCIDEMPSAVRLQMMVNPKMGETFSLQQGTRWWILGSCHLSTLRIKMRCRQIFIISSFLFFVWCTSQCKFKK